MEKRPVQVVQWMYEHQLPCIAEAMDGEASAGRLDIVRFLHENRIEGCTARAMDGAARNGHLEIVKFLYDNRSECCTTEAMDKAAQEGRLEGIKFLHYNRREGCSHHAVAYAAAKVHLNVIRFFSMTTLNNGVLSMRSSSQHFLGTSTVSSTSTIWEGSRRERRTVQ